MKPIEQEPGVIFFGTVARCGKNPSGSRVLRYRLNPFLKLGDLVKVSRFHNQAFLIGMGTSITRSLARLVHFQGMDPLDGAMTCAPKPLALPEEEHLGLGLSHA